MKEMSIRTQFLQQFIRALVIEKSRTLLAVTVQEKIPSLETQQIKETLKSSVSPTTPQPLQPSVLQRPSQPPRPTQPFGLPRPRLLPRQQRMPLPRFRPRIAPPKPANPALAPPPITHHLTIESLAKINSLLADSGIGTIECPGPGLPIVIERGGMMQNTPFNFSVDELSTLMQEISDKTRIPLGSVIFKASLGDAIITAVVSEYAGTRFIIQKKSA